MSDEVEGKTAAEAGQDSDKAARKIVGEWSIKSEKACTECKELGVSYYSGGVVGAGAGQLIDIDSYYNFYGVMTPDTRVAFKNGDSWTEINNGNKRQNNYFVSATVEDTGFRKLNLVLFDRSFTYLQGLIFKAIASTNSTNTYIEDDKDKDKKKDAINIIGTEEQIKLGYQEQTLNNNLRISWGYSDANPDHPKTIDLTNPNYFPEGHNYKYVGSKESTDSETYYNLNKKGEWEAAAKGKTGKFQSYSSSRWNQRKNANSQVIGGRTYGANSDILSQWNQTTLTSQTEEFYITNVSSTLTNTGIQYNITAVGTDAIKLNAFKFLQKYANLKGTATELMAFFMKSFNIDFKNWGLRVVWADEKDIINGEEYVRNYDGSWIKNSAENIKKIKEDDTTKLEKLLEIQKVYKNTMAVIQRDDTNNISGEYFGGNSIRYGEFWEGFGSKNEAEWIELGKSGLFDDLICFLETNNHAGENKKQIEEATTMWYVGKDDKNEYFFLVNIIAQYWDKIFKNNSKFGWDYNVYAHAYQIQQLMLTIIKTGYFNASYTVPPGTITALENHKATDINEAIKSIDDALQIIDIGSSSAIFASEASFDKKDFNAAFNPTYFYNKKEELKNDVINVIQSVNGQSEELHFTPVNPLNLPNIEKDYDEDWYYLLFNYANYQLKKSSKMDEKGTFYEQIMFIDNGTGVSRYESWKSLMNPFSTWLTTFDEKYKEITSIPERSRTTSGSPNNYWLKIDVIREIIDFLNKAANVDKLKKYSWDKNTGTLKQEDDYHGKYIAKLLLDIIGTNFDAQKTYVDGYGTTTLYNKFFKIYNPGAVSYAQLTILNKGTELKQNLNTAKEEQEKALEEGLKVDANTDKKVKYDLQKIGAIANSSTSPGQRRIIPKTVNSWNWGESYTGKKDTYNPTEFWNDVFDTISKEMSSNSYQKAVEELKTNYDKKMINLGKDIAILQTELNELSQDNRKLITLSLGGEEAKNNYDESAHGIPSTSYKSIASLFSSYTSQCPPFKDFVIDGETKIGKENVTKYKDNDEQQSYKTMEEDGSEVSSSVESVSSMRKMEWVILREGSASAGNPTVVGFRYSKPFIPRYLRRYCWGNGNASQHCVKNLSVQNTSEFGMLNMAVIASTATNPTSGTTIVKNRTYAGGDANINKNYSNITSSEFFPTFANVVALSPNERNSLADKMVNGIKRGTLEVLGDPSLRFEKEFAPYSYPIYLDVKLQNEYGEWSSDNNYTQSQLSGYYVISKITHNISASGYTTTLEIMSYPGIEKAVNG